MRVNLVAAIISAGAAAQASGTFILSILDRVGSSD